MINMYVSKAEAVKSGKRIIEINDFEFEERVSGKSITELDKEFMREIDRVSDVVGMAIQTPFGSTDIYHLSTGCKTIININHVMNQIGYADYPIVDISECGENALKLVFELIDDTDIEVLLTHSSLVSLTDTEYKYNVIGKKVVDNVYDLSTLILGGKVL